MKDENEVFQEPPNGKQPIHVNPPKRKPLLSGFIIIRLPESVFIDDDDLRTGGREKLPDLTRFLDNHPELVTRRVVRSVAPYKLLEMEKRGEQTKLPSLTSYWRLDCRDLKTPIEELLKDVGSSEVAHAYLEKAALNPAAKPSDNPFARDQDYLDPAPVGIDARWAWTQADCEGANVGFVDLEEDWNLDHEDLRAKDPTLSYGDNRYILDGFSGDHGTAVLGTVIGVNNKKGIIGVAPGVRSVRLVSRYDASRDREDIKESDINVADAIAHATDIMAPGDVLLLEVQRDFLPTETDEADFVAISQATKKGIIVVEAAGNGNTNLDTWANEKGLHALNRYTSDFHESGAILVGSCKAALPHNRLVGLGFGYGSNYGSRLDCFAWGEDIVTTGYGHMKPPMPDNVAYTDDFGGTSGAAAIIAGAALILQGKYKATATAGEFLSPSQMRSLLSHPSGTRQGPGVAGYIGRMPDLRALIGTVGLFPDVYLRDAVGDTGAVPSAGSISASPDIIVRPTRVADPTASFGEGSGTEDSALLGFKVESGQDNFIYVRMKNRSTWAAARNTTATVYWSEVSTLVTPDHWHRIGTTAGIDVPPGDTLVVTDPIIWRAADIPAEGHYCFVGMLNQARDLAPAIPPVGNWDAFCAFIRDYNNVAWRNFNVVDEVGDPAMLPFMIAGAPDKSRRFDLEIIQELPGYARAVLEVPLELLSALREDSFVKTDLDRDRRVAFLDLPLRHSVPLSNIKLSKGAQHHCRLIVTGLNREQAQGHSVAIRQIFDKQEVGRVTWSFQQQRKNGVSSVAT